MDNIEVKETPKTSCKDCVFAIYEGVKQAGCNLGKLVLYGKKDNVSLVVQQDEGDPREYILIDGRFCLFCRNKEWGDKQSDIYTSIMGEARLRYEIILFIRNGLAKNKKILDKMKLQNISNRLEKVTVILNHDTPYEIACETIEWLKNCQLPWRVERATQQMTDGQIIDNAIMSHKSPFYIVLNDLPQTGIVEKIEDKMFIKLDQFAYLYLNKKKTNYCVNRGVHNYLSGSHHLPLTEKIEQHAKELISCI